MLTNPADVAAAVANLQGAIINPPKEAPPSADDAPSESPEEAAPPEAEAAPTDSETEGEAKEPDTQEEAEKKAPPSKTWAAIYRKEKMIRERDAHLKARDQSLQEMEAKLNARLQEIEARDQRFKADPYKFVEDEGFDYDKWAQRRLAGGRPDPLDKISATEQKLAEMEQRIAKQQEEAQAQAQRAHMEAKAQQWIASVPEVLANPKYALVRDYPGGEDAVTRVAALTLQQHGKWLTPTEAADIIAEELEERTALLERKGHLTRSKPSTQAAPKAPHVKTGQQEKTVSKQTTSDDDDVMPYAANRMERIEHLAKRLRWK